MNRLEKRITVFMDSSHSGKNLSEAIHHLDEPIETADDEGLIVRCFHAQIPNVFNNVYPPHNTIAALGAREQAAVALARSRYMVTCRLRFVL